MSLRRKKKDDIINQKRKRALPEKLHSNLTNVEQLLIEMQELLTP